MEIYKYTRKKGYKLLFRILAGYVCLVLLQLVIENGFVSIVLTSTQYPYDVFAGTDRKTNETAGGDNRASRVRILLSNTSQNTPQESPKKVLVLKKFLLYRITNDRLSLRKQQPQAGDIVMQRSKYFHQKKKSGVVFLQKFLQIMSIGIYRDNNDHYMFRKIVAVPGDSVMFNAKHIISINGMPIPDLLIEDDRNATQGEIRSVLLGATQYFLVSPRDYEFDDKLLGTTSLEEIIGMPILELQPNMRRIYRSQ